MIKIFLEDNYIEEHSKSKSYFDNPSSDFKLGFILGSKWTQRELESKIDDFLLWIKEKQTWKVD